MLKIVLLIMSVFLLLDASDYSRANSAAKEAFKDFDCDFGDCPKPAPEPKVIIKEVPVVVEKEVIVEKVVYKDRPVEEVVAAVQEEPNVVSGRTYNKAFFDVHTKSQAPMLDYIKYTTRGSFNVEQYVDTVEKIKEKNAKVYIHGSLAVPSSITSNEVYMNVGSKYYESYYGYWTKAIYYNNSDTRQNSDYFLVSVKEDAKGNRYVDYKVYLLLEKPWKINAAEEKYAPNTFFFKMAPKTRGFKNKFVAVKPYIIEE
nr:hypothetical protein [uncultured Sulfurimonas sp.]